MNSISVSRLRSQARGFARSARAAKRLAPRVAEYLRRGIERAAEDYRAEPSMPIRSHTISAVIPNYNHAEFLAQRLESVLCQTLRPDEVIILDDASTDASRDVIERYRAKYPELIVVMYNETNSGSVFAQWRKGVEAATGDLVWLCESDDFAEIDFLASLAPEFADTAVMVATGRIQFANRDGSELSGLDGYRERALPGRWNQRFSEPAAWWFSGSFGVYNLIPNVGGCLFRRQELDDTVWRKAAEFVALGDWFLYAHFAHGGKIAYTPSAVSYFRQHGDNTSVDIQRRDSYYDEHCRLSMALCELWDVPVETIFSQYQQLTSQIQSKGTESGRSLAELYSIDEVLAVERQQLHVLIGFIGFHVGGAEYFPIHLANALVSLGVRVSMLGLDRTVVEPSMVDLLDSRVPVYWAEEVRNRGGAEFLESAAIDVVHSHNIGVEGLFVLENKAHKVAAPLVVSLHGSYEVAELPEYALSHIVRGVDVWVSTAERNFEHLRLRSWSDAPRLRFPNAVGRSAVDPPAAVRERLGIARETFVFCFVARAIESKGWRQAIEAFARFVETHGGAVHLLMVGEGELQEELAGTFGTRENISFLGFRSDVENLLASSDCLLLPTRFEGESQPLILIQAMQQGLPSITTAVGSIPDMVGGPVPAGIVIEPVDDDVAFVEMLSMAMSRVVDVEVRAAMAAEAATRGTEYSIVAVAELYKGLYEAALDDVVGPYATERALVAQSSLAT